MLTSCTKKGKQGKSKMKSKNLLTEYQNLAQRKPVESFASWYADDTLIYSSKFTDVKNNNNNDNNNNTLSRKSELMSFGQVYDVFL